MGVMLTVVKGADRGRQIEFRGPCGVVLGCAPDADVQLSPEDPYVSRRHAFLEISPPNCRLRNLSAKNVPRVNGEPIEGDQALADGDVIELGFTQLRVSILGALELVERPCAACGTVVQVFRDEETALCPDCEEKRPRPQVAVGRVRTAVNCFRCMSDLSQWADADGRAGELADVAIYACERCVPAGDEHAGLRIGAYVVRRRLGKGAMGEVFLARHAETGRLVALKRILDVTDPELAKRFRRELTILGTLVHENVARFIEADLDTNRRPYVVAEYVPDGDLHEWIAKRGGRLPHGEAVAVMGAVLRGLEYLHARAVLHRDIKPGNILLRRAPGERLIPKLADFGLAKSYALAGGTRITRPGTGLGTVFFMPPEQIRDAMRVREAADVYAAGATLYYLLTGRFCFDFPTEVDVLRLLNANPARWKSPQDAWHHMMKVQRLRHPHLIVLEDQPIPLRKRDRSIPRALAEVVDRAVQKAPEKRFATAAEFRQALEAAAEA